MKFFTAVLITAAIAAQNVVTAQTTTTASNEMTLAPATEMMTTMMPMETMSNDTLGGTNATATSGDTPMFAGSEGSMSGSGNGTMSVGDESASGTSEAVSIRSVTLAASTVVAGLAAAFFF